MLIDRYYQMFKDTNSSAKVSKANLSSIWRGLTRIMFETRNVKLQHLCFICLELLGGRPPYINRSLDVSEITWGHPFLCSMVSMRLCFFFFEL